ncbi:MAG: sodium:proton antiporter, partial [Oscillospiraceae bacterium]|nr:sodium:proton antiporter [Oscillospiraceae bacterium]
GGGLLSMVNVSGIIILSSTYSGIFEGTHMLEALQEKLGRLSEKLSCYGVMLLASAGITAVFCNQTIGTMMIQQLLGPVYQKKGWSKEDFALDMSNSLVVLVALCPWCIACAVPLSMLGVGIEALPWAAFLYLLPLWWLAVRHLQIRSKS